MAKYGDATNTRRFDAVPARALPQDAHTKAGIFLLDASVLTRSVHRRLPKLGATAKAHMFFFPVQEHAWQSPYLTLANSKALTASRRRATAKSTCVASKHRITRRLHFSAIPFVLLQSEAPHCRPLGPLRRHFNKALRPHAIRSLRGAAADAKRPMSMLDVRRRLPLRQHR